MKLTDPYKIVLFSPLIFVLHVIEEFPNFVEWANSFLIRDISQNMFVVVNIIGLIITLLLSVFMATTKDEVAVILVLAWFSFMMFANSFVHLIATIVYGYSPGVITSLLLFIPYFVWFLLSLIRTTKLKLTVIAFTIIAGSLPMLLHGYMIVFEGRTLF